MWEDKNKCQQPIIGDFLHRFFIYGPNTAVIKWQNEENVLCF